MEERRVKLGITPDKLRAVSSIEEMAGKLIDKKGYAIPAGGRAAAVYNLAVPKGEGNLETDLMAAATSDGAESQLVIYKKPEYMLLLVKTRSLGNFDAPDRVFRLEIREGWEPTFLEYLDSPALESMVPLAEARPALREELGTFETILRAAITRPIKNPWPH